MRPQAVLQKKVERMKALHATTEHNVSHSSKEKGGSMKNDATSKHDVSRTKNMKVYTRNWRLDATTKHDVTRAPITTTMTLQGHDAKSVLLVLASSLLLPSAQGHGAGKHAGWFASNLPTDSLCSILLLLA